MVAGIVAIWRFAALGRLSVEATSLAVLSVSVLGDKAFSPQYLIWLAPLWAYWPLRRGWLAAAALTTLVFPFLLHRGGSAWAGLLLRNWNGIGPQRSPHRCDGVLGT